MNKIAFTIPMLMAATAWGADQTNAPTRFDFPSFNIIAERNIFNMNRSGRRPYTPPDRETQRPVRTESFALVGTMSYDKGLFAFFEGSSSQYSQVLKPADRIAGFTIAAVTPTSVKLSSTNGNAIELPVGMQLKRQDEGEWTLGERTGIARSYASSSSSGSGMSSSSGSTSSGPEDPEALRRLMQRREQEGGVPETASVESSPASEPAATQEPRPETTEKPATAEKQESGANDGADDILKRLMEKREQEINK